MHIKESLCGILAWFEVYEYAITSKEIPKSVCLLDWSSAFDTDTIIMACSITWLLGEDSGCICITGVKI